MKTIKKLVEGVNDTWDLFVSSAQLAINNKVSKRHNATPFAVMFGRKLNAATSLSPISQFGQQSTRPSKRSRFENMRVRGDEANPQQQIIHSFFLLHNFTHPSFYQASLHM